MNELNILGKIVVYVGVLGFLISFTVLWYNYFHKGKPSFACSRWTALGMQHSDGFPRAAIALKITSANNGARPLKVKDFFLIAKDAENNMFYYHPIFLFDLRQWIVEGDKPDKFGRCQKGQVPLPFVIPPYQVYNFDHNVVFLPLDFVTMIDPRVIGTVHCRLFVRTSRFKEYNLIAEQEFEQKDIEDLKRGGFSSVLSDVSTGLRSKFLKEYSWDKS